MFSALELTSEQTLIPARESRKRKSIRQGGLIALLCFVTLAFAIGGFWFYRQQEQMIREVYYEDLTSISRLKTDQILTWRKERLADARMNASGIVRLLTLQWLRTAQPKLLQDIKQRLQFFLENEGYRNMILVDPKGKIHLSLIHKHGVVLAPQERIILDQVMSTGEAVLGPLYLCPDCRKTHLQIAAPILDSDRKVAAILLLISKP